MGFFIIFVSIVVFLVFIRGEYAARQLKKEMESKYSSNIETARNSEQIRNILEEIQKVSPQYGALAYINQAPVVCPIGGEHVIISKVYEISNMIVLDGLLIPDGTRVLILRLSNRSVSFICKQGIFTINAHEFRKIIVTKKEMNDRTQNAMDAIDEAKSELQEIEILREEIKELIAENGRMLKQNLGLSEIIFKQNEN